MQPRRIVRRAALSAVAIALVMSGCSSVPAACPEIGWNNNIAINSSGYEREVFLQVCVADGGCSVAYGAEPTPSSDFSIPERGEQGSFYFGFTAPDAITIRVFDTTGLLLAETDETIAWTHSTAPCGGPSTAPPLVLEP